ncbi:unnamed protein product [Symbiodinium sp. CCMP2456]|nr:unnamed protein product [Symbiodinium sp. CCMP2456]
MCVTGSRRVVKPRRLKPPSLVKTLQMSSKMVHLPMHGMHGMFPFRHTPAVVEEEEEEEPEVQNEHAKPRQVLRRPDKKVEVQKIAANIKRKEAKELQLGEPFLNRLSALQRPTSVKGNININPALGMKVMVPHQCAKVRSVGYVDELDYGRELGDRVQELVDEGRGSTKSTLVDHSFGLNTVLRHPDDLVLLPPQQSIVKRRPFHEVKMGPTWNAETDLRPFEMETVEAARASWRQGTKFALARGLPTLCSTPYKIVRGKLNLRLSEAYLCPNASPSTPRGRMDTFCWNCASAQASSRLPPNKVYLMQDGVALVGWFVAWRYPCHSVSVPPPVGVGIADNAVTYSDEGHGNTLMAGGDLDGDLVQISFNEKLIALMRAAQAAVERLAPLRWRLEADVIDSMTEPATGAEFLAHARRASSYNVRGHMCALLERIIHNALEEVRNVPNKWALDDFLRLAAKKGDRIAANLKAHFVMPLGSPPRERVLEADEHLLCRNNKLGNIWLPPGRRVLGARAATLIRLNPSLDLYDDNDVAILHMQEVVIATMCLQLHEWNSIVPSVTRLTNCLAARLYQHSLQMMLARARALWLQRSSLLQPEKPQRGRRFTALVMPYHRCWRDIGLAGLVKRLDDELNALGVRMNSLRLVYSNPYPRLYVKVRVILAADAESSTTGQQLNALQEKIAVVQSLQSTLFDTYDHPNPPASALATFEQLIPREVRRLHRMRCDGSGEDLVSPVSTKFSNSRQVEDHCSAVLGGAVLHHWELSPHTAPVHNPNELPGLKGFRAWGFRGLVLGHVLEAGSVSKSGPCTRVFVVHSVHPDSFENALASAVAMKLKLTRDSLVEWARWPQPKCLVSSLGYEAFTCNVCSFCWRCSLVFWISRHFAVCSMFVCGYFKPLVTLQAVRQKLM